MKTVLRPAGENSFWIDAARDLIIVVVGILAALWLEGWWQDRQDRQEEREILIGLREEFAANANELESLIGTWTRIRQNIGETLEHMGDSENEQAVAAFQEAVSGRTFSEGKLFFDPRHGQVTSVINSGKLGLIVDSELRALIADWPDLVADHDFDENHWIEGFRQNVSPVLVRHVGRGRGSKLEGRYVELMQSREFEGYMQGQYALIRRMIDEGNEILATTRDIVDRIDAELGRHSGSDPGSDPG